MPLDSIVSILLSGTLKHVANKKPALCLVAHRLFDVRLHNAIGSKDAKAKALIQPLTFKYAVPHTAEFYVITHGWKDEIIHHVETAYALEASCHGFVALMGKYGVIMSEAHFLWHLFFPSANA